MFPNLFEEFQKQTNKENEYIVWENPYDHYISVCRVDSLGYAGRETGHSWLSNLAIMTMNTASSPVVGGGGGFLLRWFGVPGVPIAELPHQLKPSWVSPDTTELAWPASQLWWCGKQPAGLS